MNMNIQILLYLSITSILKNSKGDMNRLNYGIFLRKSQYLLINDNSHALLTFALDLPDITKYNINPLSFNCRESFENVTNYINKFNAIPRPQYTYDESYHNLYIENTQLYPSKENVSLNLNIKAFTEQLLKYCTRLDALINNEDYTLNHIIKDFTSVKNNLNDVLISINKHIPERRKRSIRNSISSVFQYIFGVARDKDLEMLNNIVQDHEEILTSMDESILTINNNLLSLSNKINTVHIKHVEKFNKLTEGFNTLHNIMKRTTEEIQRNIIKGSERDFWLKQSSDDLFHTILKAFTALRSHLGIEYTISTHIEKIRTALPSLLKHSIPISFVDTTTLKSALESINKTVQEDDDDIQILPLPFSYFYGKDLCVNYVSKNKLYINLQVPLQKKDLQNHLLELYEPIVFDSPVTDTKLMASQLTNIPDFIAISKNKLLIATLTVKQFQQCQKIDQFMHCQIPIYKMKHFPCLQAIISDTPGKVKYQCTHTLLRPNTQNSMTIVKIK